MYYYYYYYKPETGKLNITLNFKEKNKEAVSLEMLMDLMNNINEIHKRVVFLTQPEYENAAQNLDQIDKISLLSYHQLEIENIKRENPFFLKLSFRIVAGGVTSYWTLWKILIDICKRYGKDANDLNQTIDNALHSLNGFSANILNYRRIYIIKKLKGKFEDIENDNYNKKIEHLRASVSKALQNESFIKFYNNICESSFTITDFISVFDPENLEDTADLIAEIRNNEMVFLKNFIDKK